MLTKIDKNANEIENFLTELSPIPVVGSFAGGAKVVLGAIQFVVALIGVVGAGIAYIFTEDPKHVKYAFSHVKHGLGNIAAGSIELIPGVQTLFYKRRMDRKTPFGNAFNFCAPGHETKWMPYDSLKITNRAIEGGTTFAKQALKTGAQFLEDLVST